MTEASGLWLIGFRASGKTTLGRALAQAAGAAFLDLDEEWERRAGESILAFVEREGINAFRREEEGLLREASSRLEREALVVATGGGCVDWQPSRDILLQSRSPKAYLSVPAELLWERLKEEEDRRKIGQLTDIDAMRKLLETRRPFYEKIATFRLESQDIEESLTALKRLWGKPFN